MEHLFDPFFELLVRLTAIDGRLLLSFAVAAPAVVILWRPRRRAGPWGLLARSAACVLLLWAVSVGWIANSVMAEQSMREKRAEERQEPLTPEDVMDDGVGENAAALLCGWVPATGYVLALVGIRKGMIERVADHRKASRSPDH